jgi:hypothetical protein
MAKFHYSKNDFYDLFGQGKTITLFIYGAWRTMRKSQFTKIENVTFIVCGTEYQAKKDYIV